MYELAEKYMESFVQILDFGAREEETILADIRILCQEWNSLEIHLLFVDGKTATT